MTGIITWNCDCGDGVVISGGRPQRHKPHFKSMTNKELTLDQLHAISGGWKFRGIQADYRQQRPTLHGYISEPDVGTSRGTMPILPRRWW